jgi:hypothetical protein
MNLLQEENNMPKITFSLNEEYYEILKNMAESDGVSIQDCVRNRLFNLQTIFTPAEAVRRVMKKYESGEYKSGSKFTLPELYGDEWIIERGAAGAFGKQFYNYVLDKCSHKIKFIGMTNYGRQAQYEVL